MTSLGMALSAKHIVWDWNGTLLDDNNAVLAAVNDVCTGFGRQALTLDEWRGLFSRPLLQCYERVLDRSLSTEDWARIDRLYHDRYELLLHTCGLAAGVPELLHAWRDAGRSQSLLSMWFHDRLVPLITEMGLVDLFQRVDGLRTEVGGDSKADHLAHHLQAQQLDPADVVLIGDVVDDAFAAQQVGARCVLVTTGVMGRAALEATGVPVADSIPEALQLIQPA
ncbi:HAD family hydrolase [Allokutzneria sp. A3M-2-11 16]|uniref:HAD family hydrolase n=1 Tax=Allokutzneria sp. A3M-2-11 16 TaxID=2962043 RepID=UPI0020B89BA0|nr:HAD hydrolase-like protein [Allokutzneria sp. A3M-2-11 16]MCP3801725.1 HAD family hydrolase [Allokutzneria sp. A3M-2-11 16]